jgi:hypothetical protein
MEEEIQLWKIVQKRFPKFIKDSNFYEITIDGYSRYGIHPRRFSRDVRLPDPVAIQAINFCFMVARKEKRIYQSIDPFIARKIYKEIKTVRCYACRQLVKEPSKPIYRPYTDRQGRRMIFQCERCETKIMRVTHMWTKLKSGEFVILPPIKQIEINNESGAIRVITNIVIKH